MADSVSVFVFRLCCEGWYLYSGCAAWVTLCLHSYSGCAAKADIMLVLDTSGSVGKKNFEKVKQFAINFISSWPVSKDEGHFGK